MKNIYVYAYTLKDASKKAARYKEQGYKIVGIEAEWGNSDLNDIFPEAELSLSHHGRFSNNQPPCTRWDLYGKYKEDTCFIFSHYDMDSILGCLILEGDIPDNGNFRDLTSHVGWIDVVGQHRAHEDYDNYRKWTKIIIDMNNLLNKLKKEKNYDFIEEFRNYISKSDILDDENELVNFTCEFEEKAYNSLDKNLSVINGLHVFISYSNFLHKYYIQYKDFVSISDINILYDSNRKRISIGAKDEEVAKRIFGESGVAGYLQSVFGDKAGGQINVGGSPKNKEVSFNDFLKIVKYIKQRI